MNINKGRTLLYGTSIAMWMIANLLAGLMIATGIIQNNLVQLILGHLVLFTSWGALLYITREYTLELENANIWKKLLTHSDT